MSAMHAADGDDADPVTAEEFVMRANGHDINGHLDEAIADYGRAIELAPRMAAAYYNRAVTLYNAGRREEALADYDSVIAIDSQYPDAHANRASILWKMGDVGRAILDYRLEIALQPDEPDAYNTLSWILATCSNSEHRDGTRAVDLATRACELTDWQCSASLDSLAAAYAECGKFRKAVKWQKAAVKLAPDYQKDNYQSRLDLFKRKECVRS